MSRCREFLRSLILVALVGGVLGGFAVMVRYAAELAGAVDPALTAVPSPSPAGFSASAVTSHLPTWQPPETLEIWDTNNRRVISIELATGRVETTLPWYEAQWSFWATMARTFPDIRESMCRDWKPRP